MNNNDQCRLSKEQRIWDFIDGSCSEEERSQVEALINKDQVWRSLYDGIKSFQGTLSEMQPAYSPPGFAENVMRRIPAEKERSAVRSLNRWIVLAVVLVFAGCLVFAVIGSAAQGWPAGQGWKLPSFSFPVIKTDGSVTMILIFINIIVALRLVEKLLRIHGKQPRVL